MNGHFKTLVQRLMSQGWRVGFQTDARELPDSIKHRYPWMPDEVRTFVTEMSSACRGDEKLWLLTVQDFCGETDSMFAWNEWEQQSIEAAKDDLNWINQIRSFWDMHLPLALSVEDGYAYFALKSDHSVVFGREPEFEETEPAAATYSEFLDGLAGG